MRRNLMIISLLVVSMTTAYAQTRPAGNAGGAKGGAAQPGAAPAKPIVSPQDPRIPQPSPQPPPRRPVPSPPTEPPEPRRDPRDPNDPDRPVPGRRVPIPGDPRFPEQNPQDPQDPQNDGQQQTDTSSDEALLSGGFAGGYGNDYFEDPARGYADVVRSQGMKNLLDSKATKTYEEARREYLENRLLATKTYFEMRRYNEDYRNANRPRPLTMEEYVRLARIQAPDRLSVSQLDPFTGKVTWPAVLLRPEYDNQRSRIDTLFQARATGTVLAYSEIAKLCDELNDLLMADMGSFTQNEYVQAKNFVQSLAYESQIVQR